MSLSVSLRHRFASGMDLDVTFEAPAGITALFGKSGAGKSSIIDAVAGLLRPDSARIVLDGRTLADTDAGVWLPARARQIGYVFQDARLFPHLTVAANLAYGRKARGMAHDGPRWQRVVDMLALGPHLDRHPASLSGGEKSRVALGRALLSGATFLLLDEPLAALDQARKTEILHYLELVRDEEGTPALYVSHALDEVARLANTVVVVDRGRVVRSGPMTEVLSDPDAVPLLGVRQAGAVISGRVVTHHADGLTELAVKGGALFLPRISAAPGAQLRLRIEAQDVMVALERPRDISALNVLPAVVTRGHAGEGPGVVLQLDIGGEYILARLTRRSAEALSLVPGRRCWAIMKTVAVAQGDVGPETGGRAGP
jgi:molybdate transport system ATP-binding protein